MITVKGQILKIFAFCRSPSTTEASTNTSTAVEELEVTTAITKSTTFSPADLIMDVGLSYEILIGKCLPLVCNIVAPLWAVKIFGLAYIMNVGAWGSRMRF